jgi:hypothetical protein
MIQNRKFLGAPASIATERLFGTVPTNDDLPNLRRLDTNPAVQRIR